MTRLTYRCLVIDAHDLDAMARFWAAATGLVAEPRGGEVLLRDPEAPDDGSRHVWLCSVPEGRTVKNRVHVDVDTRDVASLVAAGGTVLADRGWQVMADPDGGELCAFVRDDARADGYRVYEVVLDCADPEAEARWWAERFGVEAHHDEPDPWWWVGVPHAPFDCLVFAPVPEPKLVKNRVHLDFYAEPGERGDHVADDLVALGATLVSAPRDDVRWWVLTSPEGHEFCLFEHEA